MMQRLEKIKANQTEIFLSYMLHVTCSRCPYDVTRFLVNGIKREEFRYICDSERLVF